MNRNFKKNVMQLVKETLRKDKTLVLYTENGTFVYGEEPELCKALVVLNRNIYEKANEKEILRALVNSSVVNKEDSLEILEVLLNDMIKEMGVNEENE